MNRIRELDGLRFFAILGVLFVHYHPPFRPSLDLFSVGWVGVDLFFAISGFLITTILVSLRGALHPFAVFYWRRALRIFPAYYLVLLLLCAMQLIENIHAPISDTLAPFAFLTSLKLNLVFRSIASPWHGPLWATSTFHIDQHVFKHTEWIDGITVYWSLSIEELFYLVWAPIVLLCSRRVVLALSLFAIVICPILRVLCHSLDSQEYFLFLCRFDTLMFGSILALIFVACKRGAIQRSSLNRGLGVTAAASLVCLMLLFVHDGLFNHMEPRAAVSFAAFGYSLLGIFFASVVGLCVTHAGADFWWTRLLRLGPPVYIGTVSYMIYLTHIAIWVACYKLLSRFGGPALAPGILFGCLAAAATIAFAALSWKFFEKPILRFKNPRFLTQGAAPQSEEEMVRAKIS